jgi:hypothetical protein
MLDAAGARALRLPQDELEGAFRSSSDDLQGVPRSACETRTSPAFKERNWIQPLGLVAAHPSPGTTQCGDA